MQAFLACDRNESMAAKLLMDGMGYDDDAGFPTPALPVQQTPSPAPVGEQYGLLFTQWDNKSNSYF